jgi:hypothetical protein
MKVASKANKGEKTDVIQTVSPEQPHSFWN